MMADVSLLVDECRWPWRGRRWCHLVSDEGLDELHAFAVRLGFPRRAFQGDHYDLHEDLRSAAVALGAIPVESRVLVRRLRDAGLRRRAHDPIPPGPPIPAERAPLVLSRLHSMMATGDRLHVEEPGRVQTGRVQSGRAQSPAQSALLVEGEAIGGSWTSDRIHDLLVGAGFEHDATCSTSTRAATLADTVGPDMRLLVCGLNPSVVAADAGYGFAGPTNRFWKAAVAAGVTDRPADPYRALVVHGVGMTDLVKRATPRSAELDASEYRAGAERVRRLVAWLRPDAIAFVGLEGWRAAVSRTARPGWQSDGFAGAPAYVLPSTSGLNARARLEELAGHLRSALHP